MTSSSTNRFAVLGQEQQRGALGDWLNEFEWDHFVTLTHRFPQQGDREFKAWVSRLCQRAGRAVQFAVFTERTPDGHDHHHALIHGTHALSTDALRQAWRSGISAAAKYDPKRGASHYVSKHYGKAGLENWNVSHRLPPRREAEVM